MPVFQNPNYYKVSDYERSVAEMSDFAYSYFEKERNEVCLNAMNHFIKRLQSVTASNSNSQEVNQSNTFTTI